MDVLFLKYRTYGYDSARDAVRSGRVGGVTGVATNIGAAHVVVSAALGLCTDAYSTCCWEQLSHTEQKRLVDAVAEGSLAAPDCPLTTADPDVPEEPPTEMEVLGSSTEGADERQPVDQAGGAPDGGTKSATDGLPSGRASRVGRCCFRDRRDGAGEGAGRDAEALSFDPRGGAGAARPPPWTKGRGG